MTAQPYEPKMTGKYTESGPPVGDDGAPAKINLAETWRRLRASPRYQPGEMDKIGDAMAAALDPDVVPAGAGIAGVDERDVNKPAGPGHEMLCPKCGLVYPQKPGDHGHLDDAPGGWVIARRVSPQDALVYWTGESWTHEIPEAVRFARKRDGEALKFVHDLYTWVMELPGFGGNFEGAADELTEAEKWNMAVGTLSTIAADQSYNPVLSARTALRALKVEW